MNINLLTANFIYLAPSVECAWSINRPTAVKGLILNNFTPNQIL